MDNKLTTTSNRRTFLFGAEDEILVGFKHNIIIKKLNQKQNNNKLDRLLWKVLNE